MTQVVIKKEKLIILSEEYFCAGLFVKDDENIFITTYDSSHELMLLIELETGSIRVFKDSSYVDYTILQKGMVLEVTV